jgi:putative phage-type endonuclease
MIEKISTVNLSRSQWLEERRKSVSGSEVGAILGLNQYASPFSVWANKTGRTPDAEPNEAMRQGTDLEGYVARRFTEASGLKVERVNYILRNTDFPHLHANIDRRVVGVRAGLECKTASALRMSSFTGGEFPESYYAQCVVYMAVTELPRWFLAVVILGKDFKIYQMARERDMEVPPWCESSVYVSPDEFQAIREVVATFWGYVESGIEPPVDGMEATGETLATMYPAANGESVSLFGCEDVLTAYMEAKSRLKDLERDVAGYENEIKARLGEAESGTVGGYSVTWKNQSRRSFDTKAFQAENPGVDMAPFFRESTFRRFAVKRVG